LRYLCTVRIPRPLNLVKSQGRHDLPCEELREAMFLVNRRGSGLPSSFSPLESFLCALLCGDYDARPGSFLGAIGFSGAPLALGSLVVGESSGREVHVLGERA